MRPYGHETELPMCRNQKSFDRGDVFTLALPSRFGKSKSKAKRNTRRMCKKATRKQAKMKLKFEP